MPMTQAAAHCRADGDRRALEKAIPAEPPADGDTVVAFPRAEDRLDSRLARDSAIADHFIAFFAGGQGTTARRRPSRRSAPGPSASAPADPAVRGVGLVIADEGQRCAAHRPRRPARPSRRSGPCRARSCAAGSTTLAAFITRDR